MERPMKDVKSIIAYAVSQALRNGVGIRTGVYFARDACGAIRCCPMGAVSLLDPSPWPVDAIFSDLVAPMLGVSSLWVRSFTEGFDGRRGNDECDAEAFALGRAYRDRFLLPGE